MFSLWRSQTDEQHISWTELEILSKNTSQLQVAVILTGRPNANDDTRKLDCTQLSPVEPQLNNPQNTNFNEVMISKSLPNVGNVPVVNKRHCVISTD